MPIRACHSQLEKLAWALFAVRKSQAQVYSASILYRLLRLELDCNSSLRGIGFGDDQKAARDSQPFGKGMVSVGLCFYLLVFGFASR